MSWDKFKEKDIEDFVNQLWPIPRLLWNHTESTHGPTEPLSITAKAIKEYLGIPTLIDPREVADMIADRPQWVYLPVPGTVRQEYVFEAPGTEVMQLWYDAARKCDRSKQYTFYKQVVSRSETRVIGSTMLEDVLTAAMAAGVAFTLHQMTCIASDPNTPTRFIGKWLTQSHVSNPGSRSMQIPKSKGLPKRLITSPRYPSTRDVKMNTLYVPLSRTAPFFDAFLRYRKKSYESLFVFQVTLSQRKYPTTEVVRTFLEQDAFKNLSYVYVHSDDVQPTLSLPPVYADIFGERVYQLVLDDAVIREHIVR